MIHLERDGDVHVLRMDAGENRFLPDSIAAWNAALDEVEKAPAPKALVTVGTGKFYSNGLDLDHMTKCGDVDGYVSSVLAIMKRVLVFPAYSVAALNGHAFGAGAQIALAMAGEYAAKADPVMGVLKRDMYPLVLAALDARLPAAD